MEKESARFLTWLRRQGVGCSKCGIHSFDGRGRGVIATEGIGDGEVVVDVPDNTVLMPHNCTFSKVKIEQHRVLALKSAVIERFI